MFKWVRKMNEKRKNNSIKKLNEEKILVAFSHYFGRYIRLCEYECDTMWTFYLCDKKGNIKSEKMYAKSKFIDFKWNSLN